MYYILTPVQYGMIPHPKTHHSAFYQAFGHHRHNAVTVLICSPIFSCTEGWLSVKCEAL